jgi:hypothetical protein
LRWARAGGVISTSRAHRLASGRIAATALNTVRNMLSTHRLQRSRQIQFAFEAGSRVDLIDSIARQIAF